MPEFVYSPGVKIYIQTEPTSPAKGKVIDVSDDLVSGTLQRRSDGVSTFQFTLSNGNRKYDQVFTPNDRIVVQMKRVTWLPIFTGYLNSVPLVTVYPKDVNIEASCTLKRLQYWYWDAYAPETQNMVRAALSGPGASSGELSGIEAILSILENVTRWPRNKVHIGLVPSNWFTITQKMATYVNQQSLQSDQVATAFFAALNSGAAISGTQAGAGSIVPPVLTGTVGGFTGTQLSNAAAIYAAGEASGATTNQQIAALMGAIDASQLNNTTRNSTAVGVFGLNPSQGWGAASDLLQINFSASAVFSALQALTTASTMSIGQQIASVLGGTAAQYNMYQTQATAIVTAAAQAVKTAAAAASSTAPAASNTATPAATSTGGGASPANPTTAPATTPATTGTAGTATNTQFINMAKALAVQYPSIPYTEQYTGTQIAVLEAKPPPGLDCSSAVQWVYLNTIGSLGPFQEARIVSQQIAICQGITIAEALLTPGALCFIGPDTHVEMSIGDGTHTVGAHHTGTFYSIGDSPGQFNQGGLIPNINYGSGVGKGGGTLDSTGTGAPAGQGTGSSATGGTTSGNDYVPYVPYSSAQDGYNGGDGYDKLFGSVPWQPAPTQQDDPNIALSSVLTGIKSLLNDQPLLPYIKNLFNGLMRSFCSAPNGDLIAWFPDYYGLWGTAGKFIVEPIEILDFNVTWNDEYFVTHQFVATTPGGGAGVDQLDLETGEVSSVINTNIFDQVESLAYTRGVASIDIPAMVYALFGIDLDNGDAAKFATYIETKFGARPNFVSIPTISGPSAEFFAALFYFMRNWGYQYNADVPLTFMPELWPGMLLQIPTFGFQAYVTTVTHTFQYGEGGQFNTTVNIAAPAKLQSGEYTNALGLIPASAGVINARLSNAGVK